MAKEISDLSAANRLCRERGHLWEEPVDVVTARRGGKIVAFTRTRRCQRNEHHVQTTPDIQVRTGEGAGTKTECGGDYGVRGRGRITRSEVLAANLADGLTCPR